MGKIARRFNNGLPLDRLGPVRVRAERMPTLTAASEGGAARVGASGSRMYPEASTPSASLTGRPPERCIPGPTAGRTWNYGPGTGPARLNYQREVSRESRFFLEKRAEAL